MVEELSKDNSVDYSRNRKRIGIPAACAWIFVGLVIVWSIAVRLFPMTTGIRLLMVVAFGFGIFTGLVYIIKLLGMYPRAVYPGLFVFGLFITWVVLGSKPPDVDMLRVAYVNRLLSYRDVPYVWGGETRYGVDCSGLARMTLWQAMVRQGFVEMNPRMFGPSVWKIWWRDMSASDLGEGKYGYTVVVDTVPQLANFDATIINRGDMAIIGGTHVLIYIGNRQWIHADPNTQKVLVEKANSASSSWFRAKAKIVRWTILDS